MTRKLYKSKLQRAIDLVRAGASITQAAKRCRVDPANLYRDRRLNLLLGTLTLTQGKASFFTGGSVFPSISFDNTRTPTTWTITIRDRGNRLEIIARRKK